MTGAAHRTPAGKTTVIPKKSVPDERLRRRRLAARGDERCPRRRTKDRAESRIEVGAALPPPRRAQSPPAPPGARRRREAGPDAPDAGNRARRRAGLRPPVSGATQRTPAGKRTATAAGMLAGESLRTRGLAAPGTERRTGPEARWPSRRFAAVEALPARSGTGRHREAGPVAPDAGTRARRRAGRRQPVSGAARRAPAGETTGTARRTPPDERLRFQGLPTRGDDRSVRQTGWKSVRRATFAAPRRVRRRSDAGRLGRPLAVSDTAPRTGFDTGFDTGFPAGLDRIGR